MRAAAVWTGAAAFTSVFLTHLHSDHTTDLNDVITMRWVASPEPNPLPVVGPPGTQGLVDRTLAMLSDDIGYRKAHHDDLHWDPACSVTEVSDGVAYDDGTVRIVAAPTDHAPVRPTIGYRIEAEGTAVVIAGDTVPCEGLDRLCAGADVYVQTVIRRPLVEAIPFARIQDILDYHSSIEDAAATAARAGVGTLVLTHLVPAPAPGTEPEWEAEAQGRIRRHDSGRQRPVAARALRIRRRPPPAVPVDSRSWSGPATTAVDCTLSPSGVVIESGHVRCSRCRRR